jgi:hypothetical protein
MHVVIVAGGLGSRLAPLTNNIPKFLVNIGKNTGYVEQVRYWSQYPQFTNFNEHNSVNGHQYSSLTVIVHSAYKELITEYHKLYFPDMPLIVKTVDEANGSAHAILSSCYHLNGEDVFFQWCDVMPDVKFNVSEVLTQNKNVVFTNYEHPNRYGMGVDKNKNPVPTLQPDGRGGIFGLYYVPNFWSNVAEYFDGQDFVEVLEQYGEITEHKLEHIVDWGDKPKLERTRSTADGAREFNSVQFQGDLVIKSALNAQGDALIAREINWYRKLSEMNSAVRVPKTWPADDKKSFIMSKVQGVPIWKLWPGLDAEARELVLTRVFKQLDTLHNTSVIQVGYSQVLDDVKKEACDKLLARYAEIKDVVNAFGPVHRVNGWHIGIGLDPEITIRRLFSLLYSHYAGTTEYSLIHGDAQFSNTMIDPDTLEVTLIDPRGYFGDTQLYGLADYDLAKVYYSLSGYDLFNYSTDFHIKGLQGGELTFDIPKPELTGCTNIIGNRLSTVHQLWLAVIWIGLGGYIKNDPVKSVCAHYHGLAMADKIMAECFDGFTP